jgi:ABC-type uncharacterized transport system involved in gliding motility auxiliary subunit
MDFLRRFLGGGGLLVAIVSCVLGAMGFLSASLFRVFLVLGLAGGVVGLLMNRRALVRTLRGGNVRAGTGTTVYAAVVLGVVVLCNFIADRHHIRYDLTTDRAYALSAVTRKVVAQVGDSVRILAFFQEKSEAEETGQRDFARNILREYDYLSNALKVEYIDPLREPGLAAQYAVRQDPSVVIVSADRFFVASSFDEESITSALIAANRTRRKKVLFLAGHGEKLPSSEGSGGYSAAARELETLHYEVGEVLLSTLQAVPPDCDVLVVAGPEKELTEAEHAALESYLEGGGRLLLMTDPFSPVRFEELLEPWGLRAPAAVISDPRAGLAGSPYTPIINLYGNHPTVSSMGSNQTRFPTVGPVEWFEGDDSLVFHATIVNTSPDAWGEVDLEAVRQGKVARYNSDVDIMNTRGGLGIAAVAFRRSWADATRRARRGESKKETRIALFGDSEFASDGYYAEQWNSSLFLNVVNWLAEEEVLIGSRQPVTQEKLQLPTRRDFTRLHVMLWTPPVAMGLIGLGVWWRRRRL